MASFPKPPYKASTNEVWFGGEWIPKEEWLSLKSVKAVQAEEAKQLASTLGVTKKQVASSEFLKSLLGQEWVEAVSWHEAAADRAIEKLTPTCFMRIEL